MTVEELTRRLSAQMLSKGDASKGITGALIGDQMSRVLAHGFAGMAWITHRADLNALAVAVLTKAACMIVPESVPVENTVVEQAEREQFVLMQVRESAFETAGRMWAMGMRGEEIR